MVYPAAEADNYLVVADSCLAGEVDSCSVVAAGSCWVEVDIGLEVDTEGALVLVVEAEAELDKVEADIVAPHHHTRTEPKSSHRSTSPTRIGFCPSSTGVIAH